MTDGSVEDRAALLQAALSALRLVDIIAWDGASHLAIGFPELGGQAARGAALHVVVGGDPGADRKVGSLAEESKPRAGP